MFVSQELNASVRNPELFARAAIVLDDQKHSLLNPEHYTVNGYPATWCNDTAITMHVTNAACSTLRLKVSTPAGGTFSKRHCDAYSIGYRAYVVITLHMCQYVHTLEHRTHRVSLWAEVLPVHAEPRQAAGRESPVAAQAANNPPVLIHKGHVLDKIMVNSVYEYVCVC